MKLTQIMKDAIREAGVTCSSEEGKVWAELKSAATRGDAFTVETELAKLKTILEVEMVEMCVARTNHYEKRAILARIHGDPENVALFLGKADQVAAFDPNTMRRHEIKKAYRESELTDFEAKRRILVSLSCPAMAEQCCLEEFSNDFDLGPGWSL